MQRTDHQALAYHFFLDVLTTVAAAPKNTARRVPSLRELDHAIRYTIPSAAEGLDMSMLTNTLVPPDMVSTNSCDCTMMRIMHCFLVLASYNTCDTDDCCSNYK